MLVKLSAPHLASLFCIVLGIMTSCILFNDRKKNSCIAWLALSYMALCMVFLSLVLLSTGWIRSFPHLYRIGGIFGLLYMPLSFMYVRIAVFQKVSFKNSWYHLLPVGLYIADYFPFFLSSAKYKLICINEDLGDTKILFSFSRGSFLPPYFYQVLISLLPIYWLAQIFMLIRFSNKTHPTLGNEKELWI